MTEWVSATDEITNHKVRRISDWFFLQRFEPYNRGINEATVQLKRPSSDCLIKLHFCQHHIILALPERDWNKCASEKYVPRPKNKSYPEANLHNSNCRFPPWSQNYARVLKNCQLHTGNFCLKSQGQPILGISATLGLSI